MQDYDRAGPEPEHPTWARRLRRIALAPVTIVLLIYFLLEDLFFGLLRPLFRLLGNLAAVIRLDRWLKQLNPYAALLVFAVPFILIEPVKIFSLFWIGIGHFVSGTVLLIVSYVVSLLVVERLFHATRDQLLTIAWFAWGFRIIMQVRDWAYARLRSSWVWRHVEPWSIRIAAGVRASTSGICRLAGRISRVWRHLFRLASDAD